MFDREWYFDHPFLTDLLCILLETAENSHCARLMLTEINSFMNDKNAEIKSIVILSRRLIHILPFKNVEKGL